MAKKLKCPKCGNEDISIQLTQGKSITKTKGTSGIAKDTRKMMNIASLGLWGKTTGQKAAKSTTKSKTNKFALCQSCGHDWKIK